MGDPFFPNEMPDFVAEPPADAGASERPTDSFMELLHLPYKTLSDTLKSSALDLKETVESVWKIIVCTQRLLVLLSWPSSLTKSPRMRVIINCALRLLRPVILLREVPGMCHSYAGRLVFVPLVLSLQSILVMQCYLTATYQNLKRWLIVSLVSYEQIKLSSDLPNELLYGRAGFLWACSFLNNHIGNGTISTARMRSVVDEIIKAGRQLAKKGRSLLMYE